MIPKSLPYVNFIIASAALGFQVGVLLPWHHELDENFKKLKIEQAKQLEDFDAERRKKLDVLHDTINSLAAGLANGESRKAAISSLQMEKKAKKLEHL